MRTNQAPARSLPGALLLATSLATSSCAIDDNAAGSIEEPAASASPVHATPVVARAVAALETRRTELALDDHHTFTPRKVHHDALGQTHVRVQQRYRGVRVIGGNATVHLDSDGNERKVTDALQRGISIDVSPRLSAVDARRAVEAAIKPGEYVGEPRIELVIVPQHARVAHAKVVPRLWENAADLERVVTGYRLVYRVETAERHPTRELQTLVDANTGEIISSIDSGSGVKNLAHTHFSQDQQIDVFPVPVAGGLLIDPVRGNSVVWDEDIDSGDPMFDSNGIWGDGKSFIPFVTSRQTGAVDCYFAMEVTWDLFKNTMGWVGVDDEGTGIDIGVHDSDMFNKAKMSGWDQTLYFGDSNLPGGTMCAIDVFGHEYGHRVMYETADVGHGVGEGGGLNEANSDIWGILARLYFLKGGFASHASKVPNTGFEDFRDWQLRNEIGGGRSLLEPEIKYWTSSLDDADEHLANGPMDRAFYFMSHGSKADVGSRTWSHSLPWGMTGLGNDTAATIWMRTIAHHLQSGDNYFDTRSRTISATRDLFVMNGDEEKAVRNAFAGVDVGDPAVNAPAPPQMISEVEPNNSIPDAQRVNFPSATPVPGLRKIDVVGMGTDKDDFEITVPCGKTFTARLESVVGDYDLAVFQSGDSNALDESTNPRSEDDVVRLASDAGCTGTGSTTFFVRVQFFSSALPGVYVLHMDRRD